MTSEQKRLVRESFQSISDSLGPISLLFYARLFEQDPSLRPMFVQDIAIQGRKLMSTLTTVVQNLDDLDQLSPALRALGRSCPPSAPQPRDVDIGDHGDEDRRADDDIEGEGVDPL